MSDKIWARQVLISVGLFTLLLLFGSAASAQVPVSIKAGKFETAREKGIMKAFRMKVGYKGDAEAKRLAEKLFAQAKVKETISLKDDKANNLLYVGKNDPSAHFRINKKTGDFSFNKGLKDYENDRETPGLPTKDKAGEMAKKYLNDLGLMPPSQDEMFVQHVGGMKMGERRDDGTAKEVDKLLTVHYGRKIEGIEVSGPGSKIIVAMGANGELVSITKRWVEVREEKKTPGDFRSQSEVHASVKGKLQREASKARKIEASAPELGYFDDGHGNIEPAYLFVADLTYDSVETKVGKGHVDKYFGAVPALKVTRADFDQEEKAKVQPRRATKPE